MGKNACAGLSRPIIYTVADLFIPIVLASSILISSSPSGYARAGYIVGGEYYKEGGDIALALITSPGIRHSVSHAPSLILNSTDGKYRILLYRDMNQTIRISVSQTRHGISSLIQERTVTPIKMTLPDTTPSPTPHPSPTLKPRPTIKPTASPKAAAPSQKSSPTVTVKTTIRPTMKPRTTSSPKVPEKDLSRNNAIGSPVGVYLFGMVLAIVGLCVYLKMSNAAHSERITRLVLEDLEAD